MYFEIAIKNLSFMKLFHGNHDFGEAQFGFGFSQLAGIEMVKKLAAWIED